MSKFYNKYERYTGRGRSGLSDEELEGGGFQEEIRARGGQTAYKLAIKKLQERYNITKDYDNKLLDEAGKALEYMNLLNAEVELSNLVRDKKDKKIINLKTDERDKLKEAANVSFSAKISQDTVKTDVQANLAVPSGTASGTKTVPSGTTAVASGTTAVASGTTAVASGISGILGKGKGKGSPGKGAAPGGTTVVPVSTTVVPVSTTVVPVSTTVVPVSTTVVPVSTTVVPVSTTDAPGAPGVSEEDPEEDPEKDPDDEMVDSLREFLTDSKYNVHKLMSIFGEIFTNNKKEFKFTKSTDDNFLSQSKLCGKKVSGQLCINLLTQCLSGDFNKDDNKKKCAAAWCKINWGNGIDFKDGDRGAARKLVNQMGLNNKTVDALFDELKTANGGDMSDTVKLALTSIKNMVYPESKIVVPKKLEIRGVQQRDTTGILGFDLRGGSNKMYGGGASGSYCNFIRSINALKNNSYIGGDISIKNLANMARSTVAEFISLLKIKNKQIEEEDLEAINNAIESLERSEKRVIDTYRYISILNRAIKESKLDPADLVQKDKVNITLKMIEELAIKQEKSKLATKNKFRTVNQLLSTLVEIVDKYELNGTNDLISKLANK